MEIDIFAIDGEYAVLIEAKNTLKIEDVKEHIKRLEKFKEFFPEYWSRKVAGAVGGISIEEGSKLSNEAIELKKIFSSILEKTMILNRQAGIY